MASAIRVMLMSIMPTRPILSLSRPRSGFQMTRKLSHTMNSEE
jgi:hypothetical protein